MINLPADILGVHSTVSLAPIQQFPKVRLNWFPAWDTLKYNAKQQACSDYLMGLFALYGMDERINENKNGEGVCFWELEFHKDLSFVYVSCSVDED